MNKSLKYFFIVVCLLFLISGCETTQSTLNRSINSEPKIINPINRSINSEPKIINPILGLSKQEIISKYMENKNLDFLEGIWLWEDNYYEVAILKNNFNFNKNYDYIGFITDTRRKNWKNGEVKLLLKKTVSDYIYVGEYFMADKSSRNSSFLLPNDNMIEFKIGTKTLLIRTYPKRQSAYDNKQNKNIVQTGTGFFISKNIIITNYHVVADCKNIYINWNDRKISAKLLMKDSVNDLAILQLDFNNKTVEEKLAFEQIVPLPLGNVRTISEGSKVFTIGYPLTQELGKHARVSEGIINSIYGFDDDPRMFQISIPIQPGNSGGPLFDSEGHVIGVVTSTLNNSYLFIKKQTIAQNVNFAVKINYINNLISLLPEKINLKTNDNNFKIDASNLMNFYKKSVVLIEGNR